MPPPPPPSASYNLVIEDSSSDEDEYANARYNLNRDWMGGMMDAEATATVHRADGYLPSADVDDIPWAEAIPPNHQAGIGEYETVEATTVRTLPSERNMATARRSNRKDGSYKDGPAIARKLPTEEEDIKGSSSMDEGDETENPHALEDGKIIEDQQPPSKKKKKKKNKKKKKPRNRRRPLICSAENGSSDVGCDEGVAQDTKTEMMSELATAAMTKAAEVAMSPKSISFDAAETGYKDVKAGEAIAKDNETMTDFFAHITKPKASTSSKCISFGTVYVREYARALGTHVVPADGGWPLGLSQELIAEHPSNDGLGCLGSSRWESSPHYRSRSNSLPNPPASQSSSPASPSKKHTAQNHPNSSWTIDDFETRRQIELRQRYIQMVEDQRRRKFEKEWEKKHHSHHSKHSHNTRRNRGRSRSGSFSRQCGSGSHSGGGGRSSSSQLKMATDMSSEEKEELESILSRPVVLPEGELESRPFDYKKKICHAHKQGGSSGSKKSGNSRHHDGTQNIHFVTEEDELYHNHRGRNPLFMPMKEDDRRKVLLRDDHLMTKKSHFINNGTADSASIALDPNDTATTQQIQHDLEKLRIQRNDLANLGCSCRKLHIFLPGATDKSHHKKKGSHRRMPERKVREELRRRGLLNRGNECISREKMEVLLHDTIETEPCCWGNDCPCVRSEIGCQADTCSCWHASHDVDGGGGGPAVGKDVVGGDHNSVDTMKSRCGNKHGMYVVDMEGIGRYRERHVTNVGVEGE